MKISKTSVKLRLICCFYLAITLGLPSLAYSNALPSVIPEKASHLAFDDLMLYPEFATSVTFASGEFAVNTSEFEESGLPINRYGDQFGVVSVPTVGSLREYLVANGIAIYNGLGPYPPRLKANLLVAEEQARTEKIGIWSEKHVHLSQAMEGKSIKEGFEVIQGLVKTVVKRKSGTYLNFGDNWETDFTVQISPRIHAKFRKIGWILEDLQGSTVRIRGWLRNYGGPYMQVYFPEQIEILKK